MGAVYRVMDTRLNRCIRAMLLWQASPPARN
jgi:hypothetical protein